MHRRGALFGTVALLVFGACGGSSASRKADDSSLLSVLSSTESTDSARFETVTHTVSSNEGDQPLPTFTTDGLVDFAHHLGSQTRTASDHGRPAQETRWFGTRFYEHVDAETAKSLYDAPAGRTWIETDSSGMTVPGGCFSLSGDPQSAALGLSGSTPESISPDGLLESLRAAGAELLALGKESVRDEPTTHWRVDTGAVTTTTAPVRCRTALAGVTIDSRRIEIWTDGQDRLRRIRFTTTSTAENSSDAPVLGTAGFSLPSGGPITAVFTRTTELFDFGTAVNVSPPPADEVYDVTAPLAALLAGPGVVAGDWHDVAHGTFRGDDWTVWFARTSTGWRCYDVEGYTPHGFSASDPLVSDEGIGMPKHGGRPSECAPSPGGLFENGSFTAMLGGADGDRWAVVGRISESADDARLVFADGSSTSLAIDHETRLVEWEGSGSPAPSKVESGGETCTLDVSVASASFPECQGQDLGSDTSLHVVIPPGVTIPTVPK